MSDTFSDSTFEFLLELKLNNNREFFQANRDRYLAFVRKPGQYLAEQLIPAINAFDASMQWRPEKVLSRINRDIRFSRDKSPYRDHIWMVFKRLDDSANNLPAPYFELGFMGGEVGYGMYNPNRPLMENLRKRLLNDSSELAHIWADLKSDYTLHGDVIKRMVVPNDIAEDARPWYNLRGFYISKRIDDFGLIKSDKLSDELSRQLERMAPLHRYFRQLPAVESF